MAPCDPCHPVSTSAPRAPFSVRLITLAAVLIPLIGLAAAIFLLWHTSFHWLYVALLLGMYIITMLGVGVGYHRLYTHRSFETGPVIRFLWAVLGSMAVEGELIKWVGIHRKHHQHTDAPGDPHSPHTDEHRATGPWSVLRGMWHSHMGWFFEPDPSDIDRLVPDLQRDPVARFVSRSFALWVILGLLIPAVIGGAITGSWIGALLGFLWGGLVRVLLVHHVSWSVNSVCHLWGWRPFTSGDESRDNPFLGVLALGEGWHNTHHAFPSSARHGLAWWKLDVNYLVIRAMELLHLARNVRRPLPARIAERRHGRDDPIQTRVKERDPSTPQQRTGAL